MMKKYKQYFDIRWVLITSLLVTLASCSLDINPKDDDDFTSDQFYAAPDSYKQFLAKIYAGLAVTGQKGPDGESDLGSGAGTVNEGFSQYLRGYWQLQELTSDEAIIAWGESDNPTIKDLNFNTWNADNVFVEAFFARVFYQVSLSNEFLRETTDAKLDGRGVTGTLRDEIKRYRAEVRFLRALSYYHGIDIFGKLPFGTEEDALGTPPQMQSRAFVFDYVLSELAAIENDMAAPKANEYGRADRAALWMLKAKLLLNSSVYTGIDRSADALTVVNSIIGSGYTVAQIPYANLFKADNNTNGAQNEIIFPIMFDGVNTKTWGGMTYLIHASCDAATAPSLGIDFGWAGYRVRKEFVDAVGTTDARVMYVSGDTSPASISDYSKFAEGKKIVKFSNKTSTGGTGKDQTHPDTDFPLFRMADVYLMYAELAVVNGKGSTTTALGYINDLRNRAGVTAALLSDLTPQFILNERAKELYWEGHRRQDLIRFNKYLSGYNWQWKGGSQSGSDLSSNRSIFPIPNKELNANVNLTQNPGY